LATVLLLLELEVVGSVVVVLLGDEGKKESSQDNDWGELAKEDLGLKLECEWMEKDRRLFSTHTSLVAGQDLACLLFVRRKRTRSRLFIQITTETSPFFTIPRKMKR